MIIFHFVQKLSGQKMKKMRGKKSVGNDYDYFVPKLSRQNMKKCKAKICCKDFDYFVPKLRGRLEAQWQARMSGTNLASLKV